MTSKEDKIGLIKSEIYDAKHNYENLKNKDEIYPIYFSNRLKILEAIKKDLDRLETLELNLDSEKYHLFNENQSLKNRVEDLEICFKVMVKENEKLEKAIGILKNKLSIYLEEDKIRAILPIGVSDRNKLSQDEKELLKEVLEDE